MRRSSPSTLLSSSVYSPFGAKQRHTAGYQGDGRIYYPFHPRCGETAVVVRRQRFQGGDVFVVHQRDGTLAHIPCWMMSEAAARWTPRHAATASCRQCETPSRPCVSPARPPRDRAPSRKTSSGCRHNPHHSPARIARGRSDGEAKVILADVGTEHFLTQNRAPGHRALAQGRMTC